MTHSSGRQETVSGATLGMKKWEWEVGLYFSMCLVLGAISLIAFVGGVRELGEPPAPGAP